MVELMKKRSISSQIIFETAIEMWFDVEIMNEKKNLFIVKNKDKEILFKNVDCGINTSLSLKLCDDKELTYNILENIWIRISRTLYLNKPDINKTDLDKLDLDYPLVVKPVDWAHWNWVYTDIKDIAELKKSIEKSLDFSDNIIIQQHIKWEEHRILVIWDKVIYWIERLPAYVIGNWKQTIEELIKIENQNELRGEWYDKPMTKIEIDNDLIRHIEKYYNYTTNTIAEDNKKIVLRWISNIWAGWSPKDVTHLLWDELKKECVTIAKALWLKIAGIDLITNDLSVSLSKSKWAVLEVWATPWFGWDKESTEINPAKHLLNFVFKKWK